MPTIWKYDLWALDVLTLRMPRQAKVLTVATQGGIPRMWVLVDPSEPPVDYRFRVVGTGHEQPGLFEAKYLGTWQEADGALVWHLFLESFQEVR